MTGTLMGCEGTSSPTASAEGFRSGRRPKPRRVARMVCSWGRDGWREAGECVAEGGRVEGGGNALATAVVRDRGIPLAKEIFSL
jgi:hypothetical protein